MGLGSEFFISNSLMILKCLSLLVIIGRPDVMVVVAFLLPVSFTVKNKCCIRREQSKQYLKTLKFDLFVFKLLMCLIFYIVKGLIYE